MGLVTKDPKRNLQCIKRTKLEIEGLLCLAVGAQEPKTPASLLEDAEIELTLKKFIRSSSVISSYN